MEEWLNGTVLYYWLIDPVVGLPDWLRFMTPLLSSSFVVLLTWGTLVLEIILFMALFAPKRWWKALLISGIIFHAGIAVTMGLVTFGLAMFAGLILYLRPADEEFSFSSAWLLGKKSFRNMWPYPVKPIKESGG
jgi:antimicrobial peptide system SdpB family protein